MNEAWHAGLGSVKDRGIVPVFISQVKVLSDFCNSVSLHISAITPIVDLGPIGATVNIYSVTSPDLISASILIQNVLQLMVFQDLFFVG